MATTPIIAPSEQTITTKYRAPVMGPTPTERKLNDTAALVGIAAGLAYLIFGTKPRPAPSPSSSTGTTTPAPSATSPALGIPGAPEELQQIGGTAHSVIVECAAIAGAVQYNWYEYGTNLLLATSPTNIAVIEGLQSNTTYLVYCTAVNAAGQQSPPSPTLLIHTGAGSPEIFYNVYLTPTGTTPAPSSPSTPTPATPPAPLGPVTVNAPASTTIQTPVTLGASVANVPSGATVQWSWSVTGADGTVIGSGTPTNGSQISFTVTPLTAQTYTVSVTAAANGQTASGQATFTAAGAAVPTRVVVSGPTQATVGQTLTFRADAYGVGRAVYQFWYLPPGGASPSSVPTEQNGWVSSGTYSLNNLFELTVDQPGTWAVTAYARAVNAPSGEQAYKRQGNTLTVTVTGSAASTVSSSASSASPASPIPPLTPRQGTPTQTQFNFVPSGYTGPTATGPTLTPNGVGTETVPVLTSASQVAPASSGTAGVFARLDVAALQVARRYPPGYTGVIHVPVGNGNVYAVYAHNGVIETALPNGQPVAIVTGGG